MIIRHHGTRDLPDWLAAAAGTYRRELLPSGVEVLTDNPEWHAAPEDAEWSDITDDGWGCWSEPGDTPPVRATQTDDQGVERVLAPDGTWLPVVPVQGLAGERWLVPVIRDRHGRVLLEQRWGRDADGAVCRQPTAWQRQLITTTATIAELVSQVDLVERTMEVDLDAVSIVLASVYAFPAEGFLPCGLLDDRLLGRFSRIVCGLDPAIPSLSGAAA